MYQNPGMPSPLYEMVDGNECIWLSISANVKPTNKDVQLHIYWKKKIWYKWALCSNLFCSRVNCILDILVILFFSHLFLLVGG